MPTLSELNNNPRAMSEFMGWPYESEREEVLFKELKDGRLRYNAYHQLTDKERAEVEAELASMDDDGLPTGKFKENRRYWMRGKGPFVEGYYCNYDTRQEVFRRRYQDYLKSINEVKTDPNEFSNFIRQCAREVFGIKGRSAQEVRDKCTAKYPNLYSLDPDIEPSGITEQPKKHQVPKDTPPPPEAW